MPNDLLLKKHVTYMKRCLDVLPESYEQLDTSRMTLLYFTLSGLDVLNSLDIISCEYRNQIIRWIYSLQIVTPTNSPSTSSGFRGGFYSASQIPNKFSAHDVGHLAMTYSALSCLKILNDDFSQLNRKSILLHVTACQQSDGSFCGCVSGSENDLRFVYCAVAVCHLLQDFSFIDQAKLLVYVKSCLNYDGGFGQTPNSESHGGSTFCAVATLKMLDKLETVLNKRDVEKCKRWCILRQNEGFFGRPNKPDDSCYTFWIGATLKLLDGLHLIDRAKAIKFTLSTQDSTTGGFGKYSEMTPDSLHSYLSLAGLSLLDLEPLLPIDAALNISQRSLKNNETQFNSIPHSSSNNDNDSGIESSLQCQNTGGVCSL